MAKDGTTGEDKDGTAGDDKDGTPGEYKDWRPLDASSDGPQEESFTTAGK